MTRDATAIVAPVLPDRFESCLERDAAQLARRLRNLSRRGGSKEAWARFESALEAAERRAEARRRSIPSVSIDASLPIAAHQAQIEAHLASRQVCIVTGATGSGKTTQLPKLCLRAGLGRRGLIGQTQPRRIAARSVARRISEEIEGGAERLVGYQVRFRQRLSDASLIKVMTDGILLAEIQGDPALLAYEVIIVDEAHERSLNVDLLLGYLKRLLPRRPDLKLVIASATLETERFKAFFAEAPVVDVSGRAFPVEVRYRPSVAADFDAAHVVDAVNSVLDEASGVGDVLVFLSGEREIHAVADALRGLERANVEVFPLYARMSLEQQAMLFAPASPRRVVLATNIAETSLTVPRIRFVIDAGTARISRYSHRASVQRLPIEPISRASADQRAGRCGRIAPGVCVRLYAESDFQSRAAFPEPEILRSNLAAVLLRLKALGIDDLSTFEFLDPPERKQINDGLRMLRELGALDERETLTGVGRKLARFPLDPRVGRMLLAASDFDCVADVLVIASFLSISDPRERPPSRRSAADAAHAKFRDPRSDFLGMLMLWRRYRGVARRGEAAAHGFCRRHFLSPARMRDWSEVYGQLRDLARDIGVAPGRAGAAPARVHRALLCGLIRNIGIKSADREYSGLRGATFRISRGSSLYPAGANWVVAAELVETERLYAFTVGRVRAQWIEQAAGPLVRLTHFDAHWDRRRGEAMVFEQSSLFGLTLIPKRRVRYSPVCVESAREVFIRAGLAEGRLETRLRFLDENLDTIESVRRGEYKLRSPGSRLNDAAIFEFYDARIPDSVFDAKTFDRWYAASGGDAGGVLRLDASQISIGAPVGEAEGFPDVFRHRDYAFDLSYRFAPGDDDDGITVRVPMELMGELDDGDFEWLVPGLREEKVAALLRALPKSLRRELAPLGDTAAAFCAERTEPCGSMRAALGRFCLTRLGIEISSQSWRVSRIDAVLAPYLRMRFEVQGEGGRTLAAGRDLTALKLRFGRRAAHDAPTASFPSQSGWSFGAIPRAAEQLSGDRYETVYPALADAGEHVTVERFRSPHRAASSHGEALRRIFIEAVRRELKSVERSLGGLHELCLLYALLPAAPEGRRLALSRERPAPGTCAELRFDLALVTVEECFLGDPDDIRDESVFEATLAAGRDRVESVFLELAGHAREVLDRVRALRAFRGSMAPTAPRASLEAVDAHLDSLVHHGFVGAIELARQRDLPRYLDAARLRLEKLAAGGARDEMKQAEMDAVTERFEARRNAHRASGRDDPALSEYRWMLEEYRVSLFAQEVGAAVRISRKRLDEQWARVSPA